VPRECQPIARVESASKYAVWRADAAPRETEVQAILLIICPTGFLLILHPAYKQITK
jgi:hypothetical protein